MENTKQRALLYVAARFMMVRIDYCAKRKRARAQAASSKRSSSGQDSSRKRASSQALRPQAASVGGWARKLASLTNKK